MVIKEVDVFEVIKRSFDWAREPSLKKLFGAFFAGEVFSSVAIGIVLAIIGFALFGGLLSSTLGIESMGILTLVAIGCILIIIFAAVVVFLSFYVMGWNKDQNFMELTKKLTITKFLSYGAFVVCLILAMYFGGAIYKQIMLSAGIEIPQFLSSVLPNLPISISIVLIIIFSIIGFFAMLFWTYIQSLFLMGKILEAKGMKNDFTEITFEGYVRYIKLIVANMFTSLFNWLNKKILAVQIILAILTIILLVIAAGQFLNLLTNENASYVERVAALGTASIALIPMLLYFIIMCYNGLRLIVTLPVRVLETKGTVDAIKKTWDHTRGYAVAALITMVLLGIVIFVISMVGSIIETIFQLPVNLGLLIVVSIPVYVFVAFLVGGLTGNITLFNTILAQIAFYQKIIDAEKAEKAKIIVKPVAAPATAAAKRPAAKPVAKKTSKK